MVSLAYSFDHLKDHCIKLSTNKYIMCYTRLYSIQYNIFTAADFRIY